MGRPKNPSIPIGSQVRISYGFRGYNHERRPRLASSSNISIRGIKRMAQDLFGTFESQRDFAAVYESIETEYRCASCGYEWSGSPNSTVPDDAPRFREVIEKIETLFGEQEVPTTVPIVYPYRCPKCRHEWTGDPKPKGASSPEPDALEFGKVGDRTARGIIIREEAVEKPPYRVPLMREIHAMPWNGFNAVGTFSGCGGSDTGVKMAGFRVLWASEFIPAAQECFRQNHPGTILDGRDIRQVQPEEIEKAIGLKGSDIDLFFGSPPCSDFSTAGKRDEGWGKVKNYSDSKQRVDDLFFEFARLLKGLRISSLRESSRRSVPRSSSDEAADDLRWRERGPRRSRASLSGAAAVLVHSPRCAAVRRIRRG